MASTHTVCEVERVEQLSGDPAALHGDVVVGELERPLAGHHQRVEPLSVARQLGAATAMVAVAEYFDDHVGPGKVEVDSHDAVAGLGEHDLRVRSFP